jgi:hypothetical protein
MRGRSVNFETWFNQQELYGLKSERFYDIAMLHRDNPAYAESLVAWLRASYEAGKEALAQPEQAPMHYYRADAEGNLKRTDIHFAQPEQDWIERERAVGYREGHRAVLAQRTWVGLTLDERIELAQDVDWAVGAYCEYAEKIEAKLKEKNHDTNR